MATVSFEATDSASVSDLRVDDLERSADITEKHQRVAEYLESHNYDALLLQSPRNFAWLTSGGMNTWGGSCEMIASLFITAEARVVIATNADSARLFERELPQLGFQLKERPWHEPRDGMCHDLCRGRSVVSDSGFGQTRNVAAEVDTLRLPLTELERTRIRRLGRRVAHAVEATARNCVAGQSESEIAGELAHRLIRREIMPERLQVWADGQSQRYPHAAFSRDQSVERFCTISAVARRWGLCAAATRTVCFGEVPQDLQAAHHHCGLIQATGIRFSQPEWELFEVWNRVRRIYEKFGHADEWRRAEQAEVIGYRACEVPLLPTSEFRLASGMAMHWHPSIGPALVGDTFLINADSREVLTPMEDWPRMRIEIKGAMIERPEILRR